jgi:flavin reductase (DIM6/NTAB) family NADH-FMN oxidoreductase RutF
MMEPTIEEIRQAAFKNLHLIYVKRFDRTSYRVVKSEDEGVPVLVEYISFHCKTSKIPLRN